VQAIGAKCTHYGAPLAKGILTTGGRLTCPWHGGKLTITISPLILAQRHTDTGLAT
jgi:hypothetical protein